MKQRIEGLLRSTGRKGIKELLAYMDESGFYTAPCSTQYHLAREGGLAEHSLNVYEVMKDLANLLYPDVLNDSVIICSLLHDLGKTGQYGKANYVENILKSGKRSDSKPYSSNPDLKYVDHEVRSIQIASSYIPLTENENWAILMHNGLYGAFKHQIQGNETPLYLLLHMADMWCSRVLEV